MNSKILVALLAITNAVKVPSAMEKEDPQYLAQSTTDAEFFLEPCAVYDLHDPPLTDHPCPITDSFDPFRSFCCLAAGIQGIGLHTTWDYDYAAHVV